MQTTAHSTRRHTLFLLTGFAALSLAVHLRTLAKFDCYTTTWMNAIGSRPMDWLMTFVTALASPELSMAVLLALCAALWRRFGWRSAAWLFGVFAATALLELALKNCVFQPGPHGMIHRFAFREGWIHFVLPYAYPSGHALRALLLTGVMACWLMPRAATFWWTLGGLVALSRLYLGCHWTSDVLGGVMLALASLWMVGLRINSRHELPAP